MSQYIDFIIANLFTWETFLALMVGITVGILFGAMPGLGVSLTATLLLPISFGLKTVPALVMMTAAYTSTVYGGSITAILIHTPGTGASAATAIDGYELTKMGRGRQAVSMATIASTFGGAFSAVVMFFLAQPLADLSLKFGALEFFAVGLLGLTIVSSLTGDDPIKGLIMCCFGLLLGTVGLDPIKGVPRFTFGSLELQNGLNQVGVLMGVFSITRIMNGMEDIALGRATIVRDPKEAMRGKLLPPVKEFMECVPAMIRCSVTGVIIGIVPAAGAMISSWINYGQGKRFSKHPEMFGKGSLEGVVCSETGNNAATGGALIPAMALGIPGSDVAAIILGSFVMHGLVPGFSLFEKSGNEVYSVIVGFFLANIVMGILGLCFAKYVAMIAVVPMKILYPIILAVATMGSFCIHGRMTDVFVTTIFALVGYILGKCKYNMSPLVLGLILGEIVEANFQRALILARGDFGAYVLKRPIALVLFALCIVSVVLPYVSTVMKKKRVKTEDNTEEKNKKE